MGVTLLILAIIAIVVGISVKEYLQNKEAGEAKQKTVEQAPVSTPVDVNFNDLAHNNIQELLKEIENIATEPVIVVEEPKKPKKKRYYKPKGKKQSKKQTNK